MASGGRSIVFYDPLTYAKQFEFGHYAEPIHSIDWSNDSKYLLVVSPSGQPEVVRPYVTEAKLLQNIKIYNATAGSFFKNTHRFICIGCKNGAVQIWNTKKQEISKSMPSTSSNINCIDVSNNDNYVSAGCENGQIIIYGLKTNMKIQSLSIDSANWPVTSLKYSSREQGMFGITNDHGYVAIWNTIKRKTPIFMAKNHSSISSGIALSPINTNFFVSVGYDCLIRMCDLRTKEAVCKRETDYALTSVDMSFDGLKMMCGHRQGGVLIYDLRSNKEPSMKISTHSVVTSVAFRRCSKECNKDKAPEISIEQNFSVDNKKSESKSTDNQNDSFLNLLDDVKENIYYQPRAHRRETDNFIRDLSSPNVSVSNKLLVHSPHHICDNATGSSLTENKSPEPRNDLHDFGDFASPSPAVIYDALNLSGIENRIFKSTPKIATERLQSAVENNVPIGENTLEVLKTDLLMMKNELKEMHKSSMYSLHMLLCRQHVELINKIDSLAINDTQNLKNEFKKLQNENDMLKHEIEVMRSEREKYLLHTGLLGD